MIDNIEQSHFALSFAQRQIWFLSQGREGTIAYNLPSSLRLIGPLNVGALRQAFQYLLEHHAILRATFVMMEGEPRQVIQSAWPFELPVVDLKGLPSPDREEAARRLVQVEALKPFDLSHRPLFRARLFQLGSQDFVLFQNVHHILADGWSLGILRRDLASFYNEAVKEDPISLEPWPMQYTDFTRWQHQNLQGETLEKLLAYWKRQLAGADLILNLPTDRPRPSVQSFRGATQSLWIPEELANNLRAFSYRERCTLSITLLAAFQVLLSRYTSQTDFLIGSSMAGRNNPELINLVGLFINLVVLRADLSGNPTFKELLKRAREVMLGAHAHQDLPFERLVSELRPSRSLSYSPIFQVMYLFQGGVSEKKVEWTDLTFTQFPFESGAAKYDLVLFIRERENGLELDFEYDADLFNSQRIIHLCEHFLILLESIVANPNQVISQLPLLTEAECYRLLITWNSTLAVDTGCSASDHPATLPSLFEAQVDLTPEATAIRFTGREITYRELNARANQLAHHLCRLGVQLETPVGLCVERSLEMIIGLLGILKAGGAYVPLDPSYPPERLAFMLKDSQAKVLLTQSKLLAVGGWQLAPADIDQPLSTNHQPLMTICLDTDWETIAASGQQPATNRQPPIANHQPPAPDSLAYIIYTSGSTGQPKGVLGCHRSALNRFTWMWSKYPFALGEVACQKTALSFVDAIWEIFGPLLQGTPIVIMPEPALTDPTELVKHLAQAEVTRLLLVPSLLRMILDSHSDLQQRLPKLRWCISSGEPLPLELAQRLQAAMPEATLLNLYGSSEVSADVTYCEMPRDQSLSSVPIGRPIANTQIYLLDQGGSPVPIGVPGEIYVGGENVARGYYGRPDLTAERFIPNPFAQIDDGGRRVEDESHLLRPPPSALRLYKTGDIARYLPDGQLDYLGRVDHQVKVHGCRIELGEIESALAQHPAVSQKVVLAREDGGRQRLVAYLVLKAGAAATVTELRNFLKTRLPDYMLPAAFVFLKALPLSPNGKINRRALPAPEASRPDLEKSYVVPATPNETTLACIWANVLKLKRIGLHDNFFEIGGDSVLVLRVVAEAKQYGLHLVPQQLFQYQTIAELAAQAGCVVQAEQEPLIGPVEMTIAQRWFFDRQFLDPDHWHIVTSFEVNPVPPLWLTEQMVQYLLTYHDALRTRFILKISEWQSIISPPDSLIPLTYSDLSSLPEEKRPMEIERIIEELQRSLRLNEGPIQVALFKFEEGRPGRLITIVHHLVMDEFSSLVLQEDLQTIYRQLVAGRHPQLPPKTASTKQWIERLIDYSRSPELREEMNYWKNIPWSLISPLPVDYPTGRERNFEGSECQVEVMLSAEETAQLSKIPGIYQAPVMDALLLALVQSLTQWSGHRYLIVKAIDSGRTAIPGARHVDLSRTIGWLSFSSRLVLERVALENPAEAMKLFIQQIRRIPNRGLGYELLRYCSGLGNLTDQLPNFQCDVMINYLGQLSKQHPVLKSEENTLKRLEGKISQNPKNIRHALLYCPMFKKNGRFIASWRYSENVYRRETIEKIANNFIGIVKGLLDYC